MAQLNIPRLGSSLVQWGQMGIAICFFASGVSAGDPGGWFMLVFLSSCFLRIVLFMLLVEVGHDRARAFYRLLTASNRFCVGCGHPCWLHIHPV